MRKVACYRPGPRFPAISVTGARCELACPHCAGRPLAAMLPAETPARLCEIAKRLDADGAVGFLLSGGCSPDGILHLAPFLDAIRSIKRTTGLKINAHVGFPRENEAADLVSTGIDSFSITFPMSDEIGGRCLSVPRAMDRYRETSRSLMSAGAERVVPHALIGLGSQAEDAAGIRTLAEEPPRSLVVIAFMPLRGTPMEYERPTEEARMVDSLELMHDLMPRTKLVLGCMRPRGRPEMERGLAERILDGIAMPAFRASTIDAEKISLEEVEGCCATHL